MEDCSLGTIVAVSGEVEAYSRKENAYTQETAGIRTQAVY
jgi:hypothetical protein